MKIDIKETLKQLGLPVGLLALFAAILSLFGVDLDVVLLIIEGLTGTFALIALLINVLKYVGVISDGSAGRWSAAANLVVVISVAIVFKLYPSFDFGSVDGQIAEFAHVAGIVFAYIIQVIGAQRVHMAMTRGLGITSFSFTLSDIFGGPTAYATSKVNKWN